MARGRRVIVAISPTLAGRIMYDPPLSGVRDQLTQRLPNGSAMKAFFVYDEPFWRADGFNGQLISDVGPARMSNDTCIPGDDHGVILLFLEGDEARTVGRLPQAERRAAMTAELVRHYGQKAAKPEHYVDGEWVCIGWIPQLSASPNRSSQRRGALADLVGCFHGHPGAIEKQTQQAEPSNGGNVFACRCRPKRVEQRLKDAVRERAGREEFIGGSDQPLIVTVEVAQGAGAGDSVDLGRREARVVGHPFVRLPLVRAVE